MNNIQAIRARLGVTQKAMAEALGCSQANVSFYMQGQVMPPDKALRLITFAKEKGVEVTLDDIYLSKPQVQSIEGA
jgi:putative transcriptional regulator